MDEVEYETETLNVGFLSCAESKTPFNAMQYFSSFCFGKEIGEEEEERGRRWGKIKWTKRKTDGD